MPPAVAGRGDGAGENGVASAPRENGAAAAAGAPIAKLSAAARKKAKEKQRKAAKRAEREALQAAREGRAGGGGGGAAAPSGAAADGDGVVVEYVSAPLEVVLAEAAGGDGGGEEGGAAALDELQKVLRHFGSVEELLHGGGGEPAAGEPAAPAAAGGPAAPAAADGDADAGGAASDSDGDGAGGDAAALSRRKRRLAARPRVAQLKQAAPRPDVVEVWDTAAADPVLLVTLKSLRTSVPVPRHWSQKRAYLQGKRGLEKPPFKLPAFIEATGIASMRAAYLEKADAQKVKSKGRERMQPKMGKLDIDYQVLYDAFFRHQTRPPLTRPGDLYYEGKEFEAAHAGARPGRLSAELRAALGMERPTDPPPYLVAMQRYGPPPSYPSLRIPGLSAPIPAGAHFGYQPGGWGKPPVDELGRPLYGDVFGQAAAQEEEDDDDGGGGGGGGGAGAAGGAHWGDLEEAATEDESSEEEDDDDDDDEAAAGGGDEADAAALAAGAASTASGLASSLPGGLETPAGVALRKGDAEAGGGAGAPPPPPPGAAAPPGAPRALYTVLEQKKAAVGAGQLMGSDHVYAIPGAGGGAAGGGGAGGGERRLPLGAAKRLEALRREAPSELDVALDPSEVEGLDDGALRALYEARLAEARAAAGREDLSGLVAAHEKAAAAKRKAGPAGGKDAKKFKF